LIQVVLAENPQAEVVDRSRGIYRVPVTDDQGNTRYVYGSILVAWHLQEVSPSVWRLGAQIGAQPGQPGVTTRLSAAGTAVQGRVQPFPGDVDFVEEIDIEAPNRIEAGRALARTVIGFVVRNEGNPELEFVQLVIMYFRARDTGRGRPATSAFENLAEQISFADRNINTFWRTFVDGRFVDITKVLSVLAMNAAGETLIATPRQGRMSGAYLDEPARIPPGSLGQFAANMRDSALELAAGGNWLKAAKRAYNYFTVTGNLQAMAELEPVFRTDQARVNQQAAVLEAIVRALLEQTRVLTRAEAQRQLAGAADEIEGLAAAPNVRPAPGEIAGRIRDLSGRLQALPSGVLKANDAQGQTLRDLQKATKKHINRGVEQAVRPVLDRHLT
jgi:hypothetical protein